MINRATRGSAFKGAVQYVTHDKGAQSSERVEYIETLNLPDDDPRVATAKMIDLAGKQRELRRAAGLRGSHNNKPVYHYVLSWETGETPSQADQMAAVKESLQALGLGDRQAVVAGHSDTGNPHVHVVVNLVCPQTGVVPKLGNDYGKLSNWAQQYREARGEGHLCPQRAANNARRAKGEFVKADNMTRAEYEAWKGQAQKAIWAEYRAERDAAKASRKGQYDALWDQKENRFATRRDEIKQLYRPKWRELFKAQREQLKSYDQSATVRMRHAIRTQGFSIKNMFKAVFSDAQMRQELIDYQGQQRAELGNQQKAVMRDASREITKAWKYDRDKLRETHRQQDTQRLDQAKAKSQSLSQPKSSSNDQTKKTSVKDAIKAMRGNDGEKKARSKTKNRSRNRSRGRGRTLDR